MSLIPRLILSGGDDESGLWTINFFLQTFDIYISVLTLVASILCAVLCSTYRPDPADEGYCADGL